MNPFSRVLLSRCSLIIGASFWKNGCLSGRAMVPGPLTLAYFSHSSIAFCDTVVTSNNQHTEHVTIVFFFGGGGGGELMLTLLTGLKHFNGLATFFLHKKILSKVAIRLQQGSTHIIQFIVQHLISFLVLVQKTYQCFIELCFYS